MAIDAKIYITDKTYLVLDAQSSACDLAEVRGWCDYNRKIIFIDMDMGPQELRDTLWHEITHALFHEYAFPEKQEEEALCTFLGRALESFCAENAAFVRKYLL